MFLTCIYESVSIRLIKPTEFSKEHFYKEICCKVRQCDTYVFLNK